MNLARLMVGAFARAPKSARGTVVITNKAGEVTRGQAVAVTGQIGVGDDFATANLVRNRQLRLMLLPDGLDFIPKAGMMVRWAEVNYNIDAAPPIAPGGTTIGYHLTISR